MEIQVRYAGKLVPQDNPPYAPATPSDTVNYGYKQLPQDAVKFIPVPLDPTNQPSLVILSTSQGQITPYTGTTYQPPVTGDILPSGAIVLPADVVIRGYVEKIIADTTIVDGVEVTEHIRRTPYYIDMEFVVRAKSGNQWLFAQNYLNQLNQKIMMPESVLYIANTLINGLGITELILKKGDFETVRGNINIPMTLKFKENMPGKSLIITTNP